MDIWDKQKRSAVMKRIKGRDTGPEMIVRRYLYSRGYRYRKNVKTLPGTPDIVMKKYGVAIFVHGCFWHGHEHCPLPKSNAEYWKKKIEGNRQRDRVKKQALRELGWQVMTIWECQLKPSLRQGTLMELEYLINRSYLERIQKKSYRGKKSVEQCAQAAEPDGGYEKSPSAEKKEG